jgi:CHAD domain-containing protein
MAVRTRNRAEMEKGVIVVAKAQPISGLDVDDPILNNARLIIETRLGEMLNYEPYIDKVDHVYELHQMRIAAKRLRYSMEIFQIVYGDYTLHGTEFEKATEQIKDLQEHLGEIHDADVLVPRLEEHLARLLEEGHGHDESGELRTGVNLVDLDACQGLLTLCLQARDERAARYKRLLNEWQQLRKKQFFENLVLLLKRAAAADSMAYVVPLPAEASE